MDSFNGWYVLWNNTNHSKMTYSLVYAIYVSNRKISIFSFLEIYSYFCLCVHALFLLEWLWYLQGNQSIRPNLRELILQVVVSYLMWVQRTKFRLSGRAPGALNHLSNEVLSKCFVIEKLHFKMPLLWVESVLTYLDFKPKY